MPKNSTGSPLIPLTFVIGGAPTTVEANPQQPLKVAVRKALKESGEDEGQEIGNYTATTGDNSRELSFAEKVANLGLVSGATIFLSTSAGAGG